MPRSFAPGRFAPGLRIGSYNVRSLSASTAGGRAKVCALAKEWLCQRWAIVCVQETWLCPQTQYAAELALSGTARDMARAPYTARGRLGRPGGRRAGQGRRRWAATRARVPPLAPWAPPLCPACRPRRSRGRSLSRARNQRGGPPVWASWWTRASWSGEWCSLVSVRLAWEGHAFTLCCVYLPSGDPAGQRAFIAEHLEPLAAAQQDLVVVGDWNWVPDVGLDRFHRAGPPAHALGQVLPLLPPAGGPAALAGGAGGQGWRRGASQARHHDTLTAVRFAAACPRLVDVYRCRHPRRAVYIFHDWRGASRVTGSMPPTA